MKLDRSRLRNSKSKSKVVTYSLMEANFAYSHKIAIEMKTKEVVESCFSAIEAGDFARAATFLSDNFTFVGPAPKPLGKKEYLNVQGALVAGMPDWKFNTAKIEEVSPNRLKLTVAVSGTQTRDLDLSALGMPKVSATGKHVQNPTERVDISLENGKLTNLTVEQVPGGGIPGVLSQLGVSLPKN